MAHVPRRTGGSRLHVGLCVLALLLAPSVAHAHGRLKASFPDAGAHLGTVPREIRLEFTEVPELAFSRLTLIAPSGAEISLSALAYAAESRRTVVAGISRVLDPGTYSVRWQLAGDDGHPVRGEFTFTVAPGAMSTMDHGEGVTPMASSDSSMAGMEMHHDPASMPQGAGFGAESPGYVIVRWAQFVALLLAIGVVTFRQFVLGILRLRDGTARELVHAAERRALRVGQLACAAVAATLVTRLVAQSLAMHGASAVWNPSLVFGMIRTTVWGRGWLVELAGIIAVTTGFYLADRRGRRHAVAGQKGVTIAGPLSGWSIATFGVALLALSSAMSGHAAAVPRFSGLAILADTIHVLAASGWLGSLTLVLIVGLPAALERGSTEGGHGVARLVNAFSPVALASAGMVVLTGLVSAWLHLGRIPNLWGTRYGITLLIKLGVLSIVALTGFYNWRYVQPTLGDDRSTVRLRRSAAVEVGVGVLVLLVTAVLVATRTALDMDM